MKKCKLLSGNMIKWLAIVFMIIDHSASAFLDDHSTPAIILHCMGKVTGPCMFYFIAEGYHYTRDLKKYVMRLGIFALISHFPYYIFVSYREPTGFVTSVFFTLLCALLALTVYERIQMQMAKWLLILLLIGVTRWSDWSFWGVLFTLGFGIFYGDMKKQWTTYALLNIGKVIVTVADKGPDMAYLIPRLISPVLVFTLFWMYSGERGMRGGTFSKWAFYVIYPVHLIVIGLIYLFVM